MGPPARTRLKRQLLDKLAENHNFEMPPGMVEAEFQQIWSQVEADRQAGRTDPDDKDKSEDELKAEYRDIAERRVKLGLLLSEDRPPQPGRGQAGRDWPRDHDRGAPLSRPGAQGDRFLPEQPGGAGPR